MQNFQKDPAKKLGGVSAQNPDITCLTPVIHQKDLTYPVSFHGIDVPIYSVPKLSFPERLKFQLAFLLA